MGSNEFFENAQRLFIEGKFRESIEEFTRALEEGSNPSITYLSRGTAYLKTKELDRAIEDFSRAVEVNKKNASAYYYRGTAYMIQEDYEKAVYDFNKTVGINPEHMAAIFTRGVSYANMGKNNEGMRDIREAMVKAETSLQGFADTYGWRTQLDKVIAFMEGDRSADTIDMTEEEMTTLKKFLKEE